MIECPFKDFPEHAINTSQRASKWPIKSLPRNFRGTAVDLVFCNPADPNSNGVVHYAYTVGAEADAVTKRTLPWAKMQDFAGDYGRKHPETIERLKEQRRHIISFLRALTSNSGTMRSKRNSPHSASTMKP